MFHLCTLVYTSFGEIVDVIEVLSIISYQIHKYHCMLVYTIIEEIVDVTEVLIMPVLSL